MSERRWFDKSQPQTLQIAVLLLYVNAALSLLNLLLLGGALVVLFLPGLLQAPIGYSIANERRLGYRSGIVVTGLIAGLDLALFVLLGPSVFGLIPVMFAVALFALLVHPMSREYQRIWFH